MGNMHRKIQLTLFSPLWNGGKNSVKGNFLGVKI